MSEHLPSRSTRRVPWVWIVLALSLLVGGVYWWQSDAGKPATPKGPPGGMTPMVPVRVQAAISESLDIYLRGLGTVTAFNTVTVRSRVQGELMEVLFKEG